MPQCLFRIMVAQLSLKNAWLPTFFFLDSEGDEVAEVLDLAKRVLPKLELVLQKFDSMKRN